MRKLLTLELNMVYESHDSRFLLSCIKWNKDYCLLLFLFVIELLDYNTGQHKIPTWIYVC